MKAKEGTPELMWQLLVLGNPGFFYLMALLHVYDGWSGSAIQVCVSISRGRGRKWREEKRMHKPLFTSQGELS